MKDLVIKKDEIIAGLCPFCGHDASICWEDDPHHSEDETCRLWFGKCNHCGATGPLSDHEREAMNRWAFRGRIDYNKQRQAPTAKESGGHGMSIYLLYDHKNDAWWCDLDGLWDKKEAEIEASRKTASSDGAEDYRVVEFMREEGWRNGKWLTQRRGGAEIKT